MRKKIRSFSLLFILISFWFIGSKYINPLFLPSPKDIIKTTFTLITNGVLFQSLISSFVRISIATILSVSISVTLGLIIINSKHAREIITPITNGSRFIPVTAFYPLLIMWIGIGEDMKVAFLFIATFLYFLPSTVQTLQEVDKSLIEAGQTMGMNRFQITKFIIIPAVLPSLLKSFLTMYGIGWTYIVVAESINVTKGLGYIINIGSARGRTDMVFVSIIFIVTFNFLFDYFGNKIIDKKYKWKVATSMKRGE